jgi:heme/copper-type cytochrome/quinol oxidase subunit 3
VTVTTTEHGGTDGDPSDDGGAAVEAHATGHRETRQERHVKEHLAVWLLISGDAVFLALEIFTWFYLRSLNTNGLWRGAQCTNAKPCTDGLGNPITHEIAKASPWYTIVIAALAVVGALLVVVTERSSQRQAGRGGISAPAGLSMLVVLAAVVVQCYQFGQLPFTTIQGAYASTYLYFMGSTLAHLILVLFILTGLWFRARAGKYDHGHWFQIRIIRLFTVWVAVATCILAVVVIGFA